MEQGCCFKGSLWFGILTEESILSPPLSPVFVCKGSLAFISTPPPWSNFVRLWETFVILLSTALLSLGQGENFLLELKKCSRVRFVFLILIFLAFPYLFIRVYPNCITWIYLTCLKTFSLLHIGPKPSLLPCASSLSQGSPFLEMNFQLGGTQVYTLS